MLWSNPHPTKVTDRRAKGRLTSDPYRRVPSIRILYSAESILLFTWSCFLIFPSFLSTSPLCYEIQEWDWEKVIVSYPRGDLLPPQGSKIACPSLSWTPSFLCVAHFAFNNPLIWQREGCLLLRREASLPMAPLTSSLPLLGWSSCLPYQGECLLCGSSVCSGGETQDAKSLRLDFKPCAKSVVYKVFWRIRVVSV